MRQALFAGGLGGGSPPSGEREGRSPLACAMAHLPRHPAGSARGGARSHAPQRTCRVSSGEREGYPLGVEPARTRHGAHAASPAGGQPMHMPRRQQVPRQDAGQGRTLCETAELGRTNRQEDHACERSARQHKCGTHA